MSCTDAPTGMARAFAASAAAHRRAARAAAARSHSAIDREVIMQTVLRTTLLSALLLFGTAAGNQAHGWGDEIINECGGEITPLCRTRTVERCTGWFPCGFLTYCCRDWSSSTVNDYFR
jgi:hypothetical protein